MKFRIKEARERAGYSQKELAEIIGVAQNTFHGYESGKHDPKSELLSQIADACGVSTDFLLGRNPPKTDIKESPAISDEALELAKDYDGLDCHGKRVLRLLADEEKVRCESEAEVEVLAQKAAQLTREQALSESEPGIQAWSAKESGTA